LLEGEKGVEQRQKDVEGLAGLDLEVVGDILESPN